MGIGKGSCMGIKDVGCCVVGVRGDVRPDCG